MVSQLLCGSDLTPETCCAGSISGVVLSLYTQMEVPHAKNKVNTRVWSNQFSDNHLTYCCITLGLGSVILL